MSFLGLAMNSTAFLTCYAASAPTCRSSGTQAHRVAGWSCRQPTLLCSVSLSATSTTATRISGSRVLASASSLCSRKTHGATHQRSYTHNQKLSHFAVAAQTGSPGHRTSADTAAAAAADIKSSWTALDELGPNVLKLLKAAAAQAATALGDNSTAGAPAEAPAAAEPPAVLVTEQNLMVELLRRHPEAVALLARHVIVSKEEFTALKGVSVQDSITQRVSAASASSGVDGTAMKLQLSATLLHVLNKALFISREHGKASVLWPCLLSSFALLPDVQTALRSIVGFRLVTGDLLQELQQLVKQQPSHTVQNSKDSISSKLPVDAKAQSWLAGVLNILLADARKAQRSDRYADAIGKAASGIQQAAEAGYHPGTAWLDSAWGCIAAALAYVTLNSELAAAIVSAAYSSLTVFGYQGGDLFVAFEQVTYAKHVDPPSILWVQAMTVADALPRWAHNPLRFHTQRLTGDLDWIWQTQLDFQFRPSPEQVVGLLPVLMKCRQQFGIVRDDESSTAASITVGYLISKKLADLLRKGVTSLELNSLVTLIEHASAFYQNSSNEQQQHWLRMLESSVVRACSQPADIRTVQLLRMYTAVFCLPTTVRDNLDVVNQLQGLLLQRVRAKQFTAKSPQLQRACELIGEGGPAGDISNDKPTPPGLTAAARQQSASAKLAAGCAGVLSALALANDAVNRGVTSEQQIEALLKTVAAQLLLSSDNWQLLLELLLPLAKQAILQSSSNNSGSSTSSVSAAASIASMLHSTCRLKIHLPAESMKQWMDLMPHVMPLLQPQQAGDMVAFVAWQQLQPHKGEAGTVTVTLFTDTSSSQPQLETGSITANDAASDLNLLQAYCASNSDSVCFTAEQAEAALKALQDSKQLPGQPDSGLSAQQLVDIAQALGASKLPVEAAVMDVLAYHVGQVLDSFNVAQLPVLLWAFALKQPSVGRSKGVVAQLAQRVQSIESSEWKTSKDAAVVVWGLQQLMEAGFLTVGH